MDFERSKSLNNIPHRKLNEHLLALDSQLQLEDAKSIVARNLRNKKIAYNRYYESNIPIEYWDLKMEEHFKGDEKLLNLYNSITSNKEGKDTYKDYYIQGTCLCFAGKHGCGKTFTSTAILKKYAEKGYSCLYSTLTDMVSALIEGNDKFAAKKELCSVDILVIDEFDNRFMANDNVSDLYARTLETIFRTRKQNKLPTIMCTNSPNIIGSLNGQLKDSLESLFKQCKTIYIFGEDFRGKAE